MTQIANTHAVSGRRRMAREPLIIDADITLQGQSPLTARPRSKSSMVMQLLTRTEGATLDQLVEATGWLPHTTRAALSGIRKKGHALSSDKVEGGVRIYRVGHAEAGSVGAAA